MHTRHEKPAAPKMGQDHLEDRPQGVALRPTEFIDRPLGGRIAQRQAHGLCDIVGVDRLQPRLAAADQWDDR